eukprot:12888688-Prorocentrum_lima.AAC.1
MADEDHALADPEHHYQDKNGLYKFLPHFADEEHALTDPANQYQDKNGLYEVLPDIADPENHAETVPRPSSPV